MNKGFKFLIVFFLIYVSLACATTTKFTAEQKTEFEQVMAQLNTPEKVTEWLTENFRYDVELFRSILSTKYRDEDDFRARGIKLPIETYYDKKGICYDASNLAGYALSKAGYKVKIVTITYRHADKSGAGRHTVCAFQRDGKWWVCADTRPRKSMGEKGVRNIDGPFDTLKEVAIYACGDPDNLRDYDTSIRKKGF